MTWSIVLIKLESFLHENTKYGIISKWEIVSNCIQPGVIPNIYRCSPVSLRSLRSWDGVGTILRSCIIITIILCKGWTCYIPLELGQPVPFCPSTLICCVTFSTWRISDLSNLNGVFSPWLLPLWYSSSASQKNWMHSIYSSWSSRTCWRTTKTAQYVA